MHLHGHLAVLNEQNLAKQPRANTRALSYRDHHVLRAVGLNDSGHLLPIMQYLVVSLGIPFYELNDMII